MNQVRLIATILLTTTIFAGQSAQVFAEALQTTAEQSSTSTTTSSTSSSSTSTGNIGQRIRNLKNLTPAQRTQRIAELRAERQRGLCVKLRENADNRAAFYQDNYNRYTTRYDVLVKNLEKASARLKQLGADTTKLNTEITKLKADIKDFTDKYAEIKKSIDNVVVGICTQSTGQRKHDLDEAKAALKELRSQGAGINKQLREVIKPMLIQLRTSLATANPAVSNPVN